VGNEKVPRILRWQNKSCLNIGASAPISIYSEEILMTARQQHGKEFENKVINTLNLIGSPKNTSEWDAWTEDGTPVSIKYCKKGLPICCASIIKMYEHFTLSEEWIMIVGRHVDKVVTSVHKYIFTPEVCEKLAGKLTFKDVQDLDDCVKYFNRAEDLEEAKEVVREWREDNKHLMGLLTVNQKINSTNRRIQCSINQGALKKCFGNEPHLYEELESLVGVNFG